MFGNVPIIKDNFSLVAIGIVLVRSADRDRMHQASPRVVIDARMRLTAKVAAGEKCWKQVDHQVRVRVHQQQHGAGRSVLELDG